MKNAITAIILLIIVIGLVIANSIIVSNITDRLLELTDNPDINELYYYWKEKYYFLSLSANAKILEETEKALSDMKSYKESGSEDEFLAAKERFLNYIDEIAMGEKVVFHNIF
ncbi:MAG: hypothetical protein CVU97_07270 [Firmicutes bacterium HGW-Firmicutes-21]|nr:MAG: hypothetical protein CVU97_07270 [Firmicutes bacterium HGW-Firmicutes-21]